MRWWWLLCAGCAVRVPVFSEGDDGYRYEEPESDGECVTDGECTQQEGGNHCIPLSALPFAATQEYAPHVDSSSCGCVNERCRWFMDP